MKTYLRVIEQSINSLKDLTTLIDENLIDSIIKDLCKSNLIVTTGVGKSSHVASKVASTFRSLGLKAVYLHPTEASHGDLGLIDKETILIAYSYSGNSIELNNILLYTKKLNIGITAGDCDTILGRTCDKIIRIPKNPDDNSWSSIAPTSSVICMLSISDALAVSCAYGKGFRLFDFLNRHPGGSLGKLSRGCNYLSDKVE